MSVSQRRYAAPAGELGSTAPDSQHQQRWLGWWVSEDAVRQRIGAWAATARTGRARPTTELVRTAVGVACALAELATTSSDLAEVIPLRPRGASASGEDAAVALLTCPVPGNHERLSDMCGAGVRDVERALDVLRDARVVSETPGDPRAVSLSADCLAPAPAVAAIVWPAVRKRLATTGAPVAAPCATLRALVDRLGAVDLGRGVDALPPVRMSVRDLELVTEFRRSTVSHAVAALVRARLVDADIRAGHTGRFVIRPAAFGLPDKELPTPEPAPVRSREAVRAGADPTPHHPATNAVPASTMAAAGSPVLIGAFAGTPIYAPPGTPLTVECDAEGRWSCRVGPFLQLGPVAGH